MNVELTMLTYSAVLAFILILIPATYRSYKYGLLASVGNRDKPTPFDGWAARAQRTSANMLENLPIFTALIVTVTIVGASNPATALGAQIFFWARVVYAILYYAGVPWLRTVAWTVAAFGMAMVASALF